MKWLRQHKVLSFGIAAPLLVVILVNTPFVKKYTRQVLGESLMDIAMQADTAISAITYTEVSYSLIYSQLSISDLEVVIKKSHGTTGINKLTIEKLDLDVNDLWKIYFNKTIEIEGLSLQKPNVELHKKLTSNQKTSVSLEAGDVYHSISKILRELSISDFEMNHGRFTLHIISDEGVSPVVINDLSLWIENFELNDKSKNRTDKILFTDNIKVRLRDQSVYMADSTHSMHVDSLLLNTADESFFVYGFKVTSQKSDAEKANYYDIEVPILSISNVNYGKAYHERELEIGRILLSGGKVLIDNQVAKATKREPDLLLQLNQVFGQLSIGELTFKDIQLSINASPIGIEEKFVFDQLDLSIFEIDLNQSNTSIGFKNQYFKDLELTLKNHEVVLGGYNHHFTIEDLHIATKSALFEAGKIIISPIQKNNAISTLNEIIVEKLRLEGFDPYEYINERQLLLDLVGVEKVLIDITPKAKSTNDGDVKMPNLENLYPFVSPFLKTIKIDSLSIQNISLNYKTKNGPVKLSQASLLIDDFTLDSTSYLTQENFLHTSDFRLLVPAASIPIENHQIAIDSLLLDRGKSLIRTNQIRIVKNSANDGMALTGGLDHLYFKGFNLRQILYHQKYVFDSLIVRHPVVSLETETVPSAETKSSQGIGSLIAQLQIGLVILENGDFAVRRDKAKFLSAQHVNLLIKNGELSQDFLSRNELIPKYDDFLLSFDSLYFSSPTFRHKLGIETCQFHLSDSTGIIKNISIEPLKLADSLTTFSATIPRIDFRGINDYSDYFNNNLDLSSLSIFNPMISIQGGTADKDRPAKPLPKIQSRILSFGLDTLGVDAFKIIGGSLQYHGINNDHLSIKDLSMSMTDFDIVHDQEMPPERFLYADDVSITLSEIDYKDKTSDDSISISKTTLSSKLKTIEVDSISLSLRLPDPIAATVPSVKLNGLSFYELLQNKNLVLEELEIAYPVLSISLPESKGVTKQERFAQLNRYPFDQNIIASVRIQSSSLIDAKILGLNDSLMSIGNVDFRLTNFILHPDSIALHNLPFHSESFDLSVSDLNYRINSFSKISAAEVNYASKPSKFTVDSFSLTPLLGKAEYHEKVGVQSTWMSIKNSKIEVNNLDFDKLISNKSVHASSIVVDDMKIALHRDKRFPFPDKQVRELPQRNLRELSIGLSIDSLILKDGLVEYVEQSAKVNSEGRIYFDDMNALITNITNDSLRISRNPKMRVAAETRLYGKGPVVSVFNFDLTDAEYTYDYTVSLGSFDLQALNEILEPSVLAKVRSGKLNSLQQVVKANDNYAQGQMIFRYEDLKVGLIKDVEEPNPGLGKVLASFFANTFIVRTRNPAPFVRKSDVFYERNHAKSIFDYLVKSTLSGVEESIGARNNRKSIRQHNKNIKQEAIRRRKSLPREERK